MDSQVSGGAPVRVLLVDDHPAVRQGLSLLLTPEGFEVCAEADGRTAALARVEESVPDLAIADLSLDGEDGTVLVAELHRRGIPVLVYSMHKDAGRVIAAFAAGALGYVTKCEFGAVVVEAAQQVAAGLRYVSPSAAAAMAERASAGGADSLSKLSPQERQVYALLGQGEGTPAIAANLGVSAHTVGTYYARIRDKLGLDGMQDLRRHAINRFRRRVY